jgi:hypothetical protein
VQEGIEAGLFRPIHTRVVAEMIDAGIERLENPEILRTARLTFAEALSELLSLVVEGLAKGRETTRGQRRAATRSPRRSLPASSRKGSLTTS